jgi:hypothetical protein
MRALVAATGWVVLMALSALVVWVLGMDFESGAATVFFTGMSVAWFIIAKAVYLILGPATARSRR